MLKVAMYCPVANELEMFKFSVRMAIRNAGIGGYIFVAVVDDKTSKDVMDYIKERGYHYLKCKHKKQDYLSRLYDCWNRGYDAFDEFNVDVVVPFGVDHAFYMNWLRYLIKYVKTNRIVNCKLIESGLLPTIHDYWNFGKPEEGKFKLYEFYRMCAGMWIDKLLTDEWKYGRRFDAMPFAVPKDVWLRFGPMVPMTSNGVTGDTDFFNRCRAGGVEITKSLGSISYHYQKKGDYNG